MSEIMLFDQIYIKVVKFIFISLNILYVIQIIKRVNAGEGDIDKANINYIVCHKKIFYGDSNVVIIEYRIN